MSGKELYLGVRLTILALLTLGTVQLLTDLMVVESWFCGMSTNLFQVVWDRCTPIISLAKFLDFESVLTGSHFPAHCGKF